MDIDHYSLIEYIVGIHFYLEGGFYMKIRYALDQTLTKNQTYKFLTEKASEYGCYVYGYYKGNGKVNNELLYVDGMRLELKRSIVSQLKG